MVCSERCLAGAGDLRGNRAFVGRLDDGAIGMLQIDAASARASTTEFCGALRGTGSSAIICTAAELDHEAVDVRHDLCRKQWRLTFSPMAEWHKQAA